MNTALQFSTNLIDAEVFTDRARQYTGLRYKHGATLLGNDANGKPVGVTNCFGLFLQLAKDFQLLPPDFNVNIPPSQFGGQTQAKTLAQLIHQNFGRNEGDLKKGDILLVRQNGERTGEPRHIAIYCGGRRCEVVHACEQRQGEGQVVRHRMDEHFKSRIDSAWTMRNLNHGPNAS